MKRLLDVTIAGLFLLVLFPLFLLLCFLIRYKLGSPIFFYQIRTGYEKKPFSIIKFRTMTNERDKNGNVLPDHLRLTTFGQFLRKYSLDELPQLLNILKGEMSLVGPRPLLPQYDPYYTTNENKRFTTRPGLTGWAQINGRNMISWDKILQLDCWYVENQSFLLDLKIIFLSFKKVMKSEGVSEDFVTIKGFDEERKKSMEERCRQ